MERKRNVYKVVTRLLIWDRTGPFVLDRDYTVNLQLASINPVNGIAVIAIWNLGNKVFLEPCLKRSRSLDSDRNYGPYKI